MTTSGLRMLSPGPPGGTPPADSVTLQLGVTRVFCKADIADSGLVSGWSESEEGHTWNDGRETTLHLWTTPRPSFPSRLMAEGLPYIAEGCRHQNITLYGNGYRLGHWWLSENQTKKLSCVIEPEQWLQRSGGGLLKLVWHLPDSRKPFEMTHTQDHRQLGFCFHKLTLTAATS
jgi:hypothetical protein